MRQPQRRRAARIVKALVLVACAFVYALTQGVSFAQNNQPRDGRYYEQQAVKAYQQKDFTSFLENMKTALSLRPNHPRLTYNLAVAHALNGNKSEALAGLERLAGMGLIYPAERDKDFASLKDSVEFENILKKFQSNKAPVVNSATAFTIQEKGLVPESVAYDPAGETFYLGSVYKRKILSVDRKGEVKEFATERDGLWSVLGMKVDARRRHLWVATAAHAQMTNYKPEQNGESAVLKFELGTNKLLKKYALPNKPAAHLVGDLVVSSGGDVFATDSLSPAVYVIRRAKDEIEPLVVGEPYVSPQGIAFAAGEKQLFVADYSRGIFVMDARTGKSRLLASRPDTALLGVDGIYTYKGTLIGVQNGVNPNRLVRLFLDRDMSRVERLEVIEANHPLYDEPTLGVLVKDTFYYIANSQWWAIDKGGQLAAPEKLQYPVVLKVSLLPPFKAGGRRLRTRRTAE